MGFGHAPHEEGDRSVHAKKGIVERLPAVVLDALYPLVEGIAVFLQQRVKGFAIDYQTQQVTCAGAQLHALQAGQGEHVFDSQGQCSS